VLQYLTFLVSVPALLGLGWYVIETYKLRKAAQDQLEASQRPCLVVAGMMRAANEAIMRPGSPLLVVAPFNGSVALMNIGPGPAFNAIYHLTSPDREGRNFAPHSMVHVLNDEANPVPIPFQTVSNGRWLLTLSCESLSKRRYESKTVIEDGVLVTVEHREIT
jgi:hypothetical protein